MCGDRFSSSTTCSRWRHETEPGRLDQSLSCRFWKVATHPFELLVLTVARSGEVRLATWDEMDLDAAVWTIPAARMKAKRDHRVPLSGAGA